MICCSSLFSALASPSLLILEVKVMFFELYVESGELCCLMTALACGGGGGQN